MASGATAGVRVRLPVDISYEGKRDLHLMNGISRSTCVRILLKFKTSLAGIVSQRITLHYDGFIFDFLQQDQQWLLPNGSFDPNLLVEPGTFSNIDNGYGFFRGGSTVSVGWFPSLIVQRNIGFRTASPCPMGARNIPVCQLFPEPCLSQGE